MNWKSGVTCVKYTASGKLLYIRELSLVLCDDLEEWDWGGRIARRFKRQRTHVYTKLIHVVQQELTQHCNAVIFQFKKKEHNKLI